MWISYNILQWLTYNTENNSNYVQVVIWGDYFLPAAVYIIPDDIHKNYFYLTLGTMSIKYIFPMYSLLLIPLTRAVR